MDNHDDIYGILRYNDLVGGIPTPLKNMNVSWDNYSQYMEKDKMFQTTNQFKNGVRSRNACGSCGS